MKKWLNDKIYERNNEQTLLEFLRKDVQSSLPDFKQLECLLLCISATVSYSDIRICDQHNRSIGLIYVHIMQTFCVHFSK